MRSEIRGSERHAPEGSCSRPAPRNEYVEVSVYCATVLERLADAAVASK